MKKAKLVAAASVATLVALAGGIWFYQRADATELPSYRFGVVERGSVRSTVSATGSLVAVRTVQVGTQVSGQLSAILVDFNDRVRKGQLLATIDPTLQRQTVADAQAGLERAQAQYELAREEYDRNKQLFDARIVTAAEYSTVTANQSVARANVKAAEIALSRARQNLAYTNIYSPIDGVIVERNVDVGQTVAASLSAPQLFLIANDLSAMQILASVDEGDIGSIQKGQDVQFTVQSYPNRQFHGRVEQVRLQSKITENVVSYTVVVSVANESGLLLPGMTATLMFTTGSADNALTVPSAALRFRPNLTPRAGIGDMMPNAGATRPNAGATMPNTGGAIAVAGGAGARPQRGAVIWHLDAEGHLAPLRVTPGLSDGTLTVVSGAGLTEGMRIVVGVNDADARVTAPAGGSSTNPLQPQLPRGPGGGGPPGRF